MWVSSWRATQQLPSLNEKTIPCRARLSPIECAPWGMEAPRDVELPFPWRVHVFEFTVWNQQGDVDLLTSESGEHDSFEALPTGIQNPAGLIY